jgi:hypothetical protein
MCSRKHQVSTILHRENHHERSGTCNARTVTDQVLQVEGKFQVYACRTAYDMISTILFVDSTCRHDAQAGCLDDPALSDP